jgi:ligand-binding sensor domain-containing protein
MVKIILLLIISFNLLKAQFELTNWQAYSSFNDINAACMDNDNNVWVATTGGVFRYSRLEDSYYEYRNINELLSIRSTEIYFDENSNKVFVGSADGFIDIYHNGDWYHNSDIYSSSQFSNKRINHIEAIGNEAYIGGGFGLAIYDIENNIFISDIQRFGIFNQTTVNHIHFANDTIWLATNQGIAFASMDSLLNNPSSWQNYNKNNGLINDNVSKVIKVGNELFALDASGVYKMYIGSFEIIRQGTFFSIDEINGSLHITGYSSILNMEEEKNIYASQDDIFSGMDKIGDNTYLIHTVRNGLLFLHNSKEQYLLPNCPVTNRIEDIDIQTDGKIWFATGDDKNGRGIMIYDGNHWTNLTRYNRDDLKSNAFKRILVTEEDEIFASGWGPGFVTINEADTGFVITTYDTSNTELTGISDAPAFLAMGEPAEDRFGNVWLISYAKQGTSGDVIGVMEKQSQNFYSYDNPYSPILRNYYTLGIDMNDTKWLGGYKLVGTGLLYFNDNGTLDNHSDDFAGLISVNSEPELLSNVQNAIETDKNGLVWIGTPSGLSVLLNPEAVIFDSQLIFRRINLIATTEVNDIFIDDLNNKWIATNDGVWVLNSDGSEILDYVNSDNSPLPDNSVLSVMVDGSTGRAYFGTMNGLFSAQSFSATPIEKYDISTYPQPFNPGKDEYLKIDGLSENSIIKITTASGEYINEVRANGRIAVWDGRDKNGERVASGVYLLITQSVSNGKSGVAKIAVVNK